VSDSLKNKVYSLITEIDSAAKTVTSQELENAIKQLEAVRDQLKDNNFPIAFPSKPKKTHGRPPSTKRLLSKSEVLDAEVKKKAKLLAKK
jgi:hypothetical protein